jgi:acylphosphatase
VTSGETVRAEILVSGRVQGVGFRRFARNAAERLGVDSNPMNLRDGKVFIIAEGRPEAMELYISELRRGPMFAHVENVDVTFREAVGNVYDQAF